MRRPARAGYHITIETAAVAFKPVACDLASLSPKLSTSTPHQRDGGRYALRHDERGCGRRSSAPSWSTADYQLKFVIDRPEDIDEMLELLRPAAARRSRPRAADAAGRSPARSCASAAAGWRRCARSTASATARACTSTCTATRAGRDRPYTGGMFDTIHGVDFSGAKQAGRNLWMATLRRDEAAGTRRPQPAGTAGRHRRAWAGAAPSRRPRTGQRPRPVGDGLRLRPAGRGDRRGHVLGGPVHAHRALGEDAYGVGVECLRRASSAAGRRTSAG